MLFSSPSRIFLVTAAAFWGTPCLADLVEYTWEVTWMLAAPDGFDRPVIGVNGVWPCPEVRAKTGDTIKLTLTNSLGNQTTGIHWHGINQISTSWMDGPSLVTQCPVPPGETIVYKFLADEPGTYWYHSHNMGQYPDGFRGPLIIEDPDDPYGGDYSEEHTIIFSDWYHNQSIPLVQKFLSPANPIGIPPIPDSMTINDGAGSDLVLNPGTHVRLRLICVSAIASFMVEFGDAYEMDVIMNDGAYIKRTPVKQLRIAPAQRFDVLIKVPDKNLPYLASLDTNTDWTTKNVSALRWLNNGTGYLVTDPDGPRAEKSVALWQPYDDSTLEPYDGKKIMPPSDKTYVFDFTIGNDNFGIHRSYVNGATYVSAKVPTLYTAATTGKFNTNPIVYGGVNPFIVSYGDVVDIVVNNHDRAAHPFHLHGHHFQVLTRPASGSGFWAGHEAESSSYNPRPPRRDTTVVMPGSHAVLRYKADNPGVYLFHCHIEWHVESGLTATIIEAPEKLRGLDIPQDHISACKKVGMAYEGNAGGAVDDPLDTSGMVFDPPELYVGATWIEPDVKKLAKRSRIERRMYE